MLYTTLYRSLSFIYVEYYKHKYTHKSSCIYFEFVGIIPITTNTKGSRALQHINKIIHKEKNQKKTTVNSPFVNSLIDNSTNVKSNTAVNSISEQLAEHQIKQKSIANNKLADKERNIRMLRNAEIDECIEHWINIGLTTDQFAPWVAKCCHQLGLNKVNRFAISAQRGNNPDRLFSSLLKAALQLKAKREYVGDPTDLDD